MSKRSLKPFMKVENLETEEQLQYMEAVLYTVIMLHPNRLLQTEVKRRKIQAKEKNAKVMALQCQMESSRQRQTRLQDISACKAIYSQLETLEKRAIIYNFIL